jgi:Domain of unknown function (DUF4340)
VKPRALATPIGLLVLGAGAVAYAYLVDRGRVSDADRAARSRDVFPSFRIDEVTRLELEHGSEVLVLERDAGRGVEAARTSAPWVMTAPRNERAAGAAVDVLLRELELATRLREVSEGALGFEAPRTRGKVRAGNVEYRFALGADSSRPDGAAYMRVDGEGTFVIARALKVQLLRGADAYRDRTVVPFGGNDVARIDVDGVDGRGFVLTRTAGTGPTGTAGATGATFRVAGSGLRASREPVERLLTALADARAETFLDDATADKLLSSGSIRVSIQAREENQANVELRVGGACGTPSEGAVIVRTAPTRVSVCAAKTIVSALHESSESLLDRSLLYAHADEIETMRLEDVEGGGARLELARKGNGWRERAPDDRDLDAEQSDYASALALSLVGVQALAAPRPGGRPHFALRSRATVVRTGTGTSETLDLAAPGPDGISLVRRADDGAILPVGRTVARRFEPETGLLGLSRLGQVWRPAFDPGEVIAVDNGCAPTRERIELRGRSWTMTSPPGFSVDPVAVSDLTGALARVKAELWIAVSDDGGLGLEPPASCTVTLTLKGRAGSPGRRASVAFGGRGDGGVYARTLDDPAVFVAAGSLRDLLSHPEIDRSRFRLDPKTLSRVVLSRGASQITLRRTEGGLTRHPDDDSEAGPGDAIEAALAGFYAVCAVHTGPPTKSERLDDPTLLITTTKAAGPDGGAATEDRIVIGGEAQVDGADVYTARVSGVDATFAVPLRAVKAILDAW